MLRLDLAIIAEVREAAAAIAKLTDRVDVLINNAGGTSRERRVTSEGNEATFSGNYLGHFVLTNELLPLLRHAAKFADKGQTRILNVSSVAHEYTPGLDWDDLQSIAHFDVDKAYTNAKLANLLHAQALARRVKNDGIVVHAMHPGIVATNFVTHGNDAMAKTFVDFADITVSPVEGADTLIWLATSRDTTLMEGGGYFHARTAVPTAAAANDDAAAERLWSESLRLTTEGRLD